MKTKLLALSLLVLISALTFIRKDVVAVHDLSDGVVLVPDHIGSYQLSGPHWRNSLTEGRVEEGGIYTVTAVPGKSSLPVQLDYYRHAAASHNGLGCYLAQGETLHWQRRQTVATAGGKIDFLLGLTQTRDQVRLVAATECSERQCVGETPIESWSFLRARKALLGETGDATQSVVPVSVVLTVLDDGRDLASLQTELLDQFQSFAASLDLSGTQHVAALQLGHGNG